MQPANNFIVLNIREYLENEDKRLGEETLVQLLSEFSCPLNPDVERFLKEQAIDFAKKTSVSYIFGIIIGGCRAVGVFFYYYQTACCKV